LISVATVEELNEVLRRPHFQVYTGSPTFGVSCRVDPGGRVG
jgi:hypothetical protein